jgi:futalosine hydrolase
MQILLFAATVFEIEPTIAYLKQQDLSGQITVQITGVGLAAAVYSITKGVLTYRPSLMIQAGIAGSFDPSLGLAETVVVDSEMLGDLGVIDKGAFKSIFDLGLADLNAKPFTNGKLINSNTELINNINGQVVTGVTVQEITTNPEKSSFYGQTSGAQIETMEGAALHYVGLMENIPFLQLRTVSNYVGERDKKNWRLTEAIAELNSELQALLFKIMD